MEQIRESEFVDESRCGRRIDIHVTDVIHEYAGGTFAGAEALSEFDGHASVRSGFAGVNPVFVADGFQQFFSSAQHAGDTAAEPDPVSSERVGFVLEEVVEGHGVMNFSRVQFQQFCDFHDGFPRDGSESVVDEVQGRESDCAFIRVLGEFSPNLFSQLFTENAHNSQPE